MSIKAQNDERAEEEEDVEGRSNDVESSGEERRHGSG